MISTSIKMYLETLAGYIFDDDKLVTYKWLSKELGLHVNLAKQILWQFLNEHEKRKDVLATFTLMGYLGDGNLRVEVVRESDISWAKKKFSKLTGEHVYSLQRALPDIELLALSGIGDYKQAAIICKEILPREEKELHNLRWGSKFPDPKTLLNSIEKSSKSNSKQDSNTEKKKLPNNIFARVNNKNNEPTKQPILNTQKVNDGVSRGKKRQGSQDREEIGSKRQKQKSESEESSGNECEEPDLDRHGSGRSVSSSNIAGPASPPKYKMENGKRKVRKVVDKTSTDSDGYLVTKKEYVYESCSDDEELDTVAKITQAPKLKVSAAIPKANRKQASLLNFFKKS